MYIKRFKMCMSYDKIKTEVLMKHSKITFEII